MPKDLLEIRHFTGGVVGSADERDVPLDAASYAANIDPVTNVGMLSGLATDTRIENGASSPVGGGGEAYTLFDDGTKAAYYDGTNAKVVEGLDATPSETDLGAVTSSGNFRSGVADARAVHMGMGGASTSPPQWIGEITHGQIYTGGAYINAAPSGLQIEEATLRKSDYGSPDYANINTTSETAATASEDALFASTATVVYDLSMVYDGVQEGPIFEDVATAHSVSSGTGVSSIDVTIRVNDGIPARVTHINLYRSVRDSGTETDIYFVTSIDLSDQSLSWTSVGSGNYDITVTDDVWSSQSYEARTGIPPTLQHMNINYGLSVESEGYHFVGRCYVADDSGNVEISDAANYIFRSKAYRFDTFVWSEDYLHLPTTPTALAFFAGRIFAFGEGRLYIVNPTTLAIEDAEEGIGCIGPDAFVVTSHGLFWASEKNIFFHDGARIHPVGEAILENQYDTSVGWLNATKTAASCVYDAVRDLYLATFQDGGNNRAWAWHRTTNRWSLVTFESGSDTQYATGSIGGRFHGADGTPYLSLGTSLYSIFTGASTRAWDWVSKRITLEEPTRRKKFYEARVTGDEPTLTYSENGGAFASCTLSALSGGVREGVVNSGGSGAWVDVKDLRVRMQGAVGEVVRNLGITFRMLGRR